MPNPRALFALDVDSVHNLDTFNIQFHKELRELYSNNGIFISEQKINAHVIPVRPTNDNRPTGKSE